VNALPSPAADLLALFMTKKIDSLFGALLGAAPQPLKTPSQQLFGYLDKLLPFLDDLPDPELTQRHRDVLGGHLFDEGPLIVRSVAGAMRRSPEQFADIPEDPDELWEEQDRAYALATLAHAFQALADRAADQAMVSQASAVARALRIIRHVRADADRPYAGEQSRLRAGLLRMAEYLLRRRQAKIRGA
jgi:hypothetical protein